LGGKIRLETDGLASVFFGRDIAPDLEGNVDTLVVALKAQDSETYEKICKPKISNAHEAVVEFIRRTSEFVPNVTVTAMADTEGVDLAACQRLTQELDVDFSPRSPDQYC
jgi:TatD DNase family protein